MKRIALTIALFSCFYGIFTSNAHAIDCSGTFDQSSRTIRGCLGGFSSPDELKKNSAIFSCTSNSNFPYTFSACRSHGLTQVTFDVSFRDADIQHDAKGYWGCVGAEGIHRAMGRMDISFKNSDGSEICSKAGIYTKPPDWCVSGKEGILCKNALAGFGDESNTAKICEFAGNNASCIDCFQNQGGAWTAIGCIPTSPDGFIKKFLGFAVGIAGGIAFLLILVSGFQILTSAGNPEKMTAGKELLSAAISGLILIIFSIFLLRLIGFTILGIPGFG